MYVAAYLLMKTILNTTLICSSRASESKGHRDIAESSKGHDESCLFLILNSYLVLMITGVSI
jgi:hypothetical protein